MVNYICVCVDIAIRNHTRVRENFGLHSPKINDTAPYIDCARLLRLIFKEQVIRGDGCEFTTRKQRDRRETGNGTAKRNVSSLPVLDGYLLKQLRVLITRDYKFNRTSFVITARAHYRSRYIILSLQATPPVAVTPASIYHILSAKVAKIGE